MSKYPSHSIQKRIAANIHKINGTDRWLYAVSTQWMNTYKKQFEDQPDILNTALERKCPPVNVDTEIKDNEFISEKWLKILVSWYGLDKMTTIIRRPVSSTYLTVLDNHAPATVLLNKEFDFLVVSCCMLDHAEDETSHRFIFLHALDTFDFLEYQIRRAFNISGRSKSRLWMNIRENDSDVVFDCIETTTENLLAKIVNHLTWLPKHLLTRDQKPSSPGKPTTDPFLLSEKNIKIIIAIEIFAMELPGNETEHKPWLQHAIDLEGEGDSIVTLATINSQWDEQFTNYLDEFTREMSDITLDKRGVLINTAKEIVNEKLSQTEKLKVQMEVRMKNLDEKEKKLIQREDEVSQREEDYKRKLSQYKEGLDKFMKEKRRLESEWERVKEQNIITDSQITLNIGGEKFTTSLTTLTNIQDSEFVHLFCGTYVAKPSDDGSYFFDRDGTHFRHILNYLRNGPKTVSGIPNNENILNELLNEAKYYNLPELEALITEKIDNLTPSMIGDFLSYPSASFSSLSSK